MLKKNFFPKGIQFGDTQKEVRAKETIAIAEGISDEQKLYTDAGDFAGFKDVSICYEFDDEGKLIEVKWYLFRYSAGASNRDYEELKKYFQRKYGTPLDYSNGETYPIITSAFDSAWAAVYVNQSMGEDAAIQDYSEWDYEYQDGQHVKIDLIQLYYGNTDTGYYYDVLVGYKQFTDEELNAAK